MAEIKVNEKPKTKQSLKYLRDKDREIVRGIFRYHEIPGGTLEFSLKRYKEDPVEKFKLEDGKVYSLPLGAAKHLNQEGWYPVHAYTKDADGVTSKKIGRKVHRFAFESLEFTDIEGLEKQPDIITVEKA